MEKMSEKRRAKLADSLLLLTGVIWGSGFVVMKNALDGISTNYLLALRFTLAAVGVAIMILPRLRRLTRKDLFAGLVIGTALYFAYALQTYGLMYTTAGNNAFLTATYVVLVPFFMWGIAKVRPDRYNVLAAVVCLIGIGVLSLGGGLSINLGDGLTLLCGIFYALHIVAISYFAKKHDMMVLVMLQFAFCALWAWGVGGVSETFPTHFSSQTLWGIAYLGLACTMLALSLQNIGIKYADPSHASLLMSTESLFGCLFGCLLLGEPFTVRIFIGTALIFLAVVISETKLSMFKKRYPREHEKLQAQQARAEDCAHLQHGRADASAQAAQAGARKGV